jgi:hypothetical protein
MAVKLKERNGKMRPRGPAPLGISVGGPWARKPFSLDREGLLARAQGLLATRKLYRLPEPREQHSGGKQGNA